MARTILLLRHGPLDAAYEQRYVGRLDAPLAASWLPTAPAVGDFLRTRKPATCLCSPLLRARQTADAVATGLPVALDDDLAEIDFGRWDGRTWDDVAAAERADVAGWWEFRDGFAFPGGESLAGFSQRTRRVADRLAADPADTVLAISHGGPIRMMLCHLLGLPAKSFLMFNPRRGLCAVVESAWGSGWVLTGLNVPGMV